MGITWETPATDSRRLRSTQSATLRASIICARRPASSCASASFSQETERKRISPMTEEIGAMAGAGTSGGSCEETSWSFSLTICRAV